MKYLCTNGFKKMLFILLIILQSGFYYRLLASEQLQFEHYSRYNGLPNNSVNFIYKDTRGFMWFCTEGGLSRYDGYKYVTFINNPNDTNSISDDLVKCICEESSGKFWIGTQNGLNLFDPVSEKFTRIELDKYTQPNVQYNWVTAIIPCKAGGIWVASRSGLYRILTDSINISWIDKKNDGNFIYQSNKMKMVHYKYSEKDTNSLNDNGLYCLYEDENGILWIGSDNGGSLYGALHKLTPGSKRDYPPVFKKYVYNGNIPDKTLGKYLMSIYKDRFGNFWIGTWQDGLYRFNPVSEEITRFKNIPNDPTSINCDKIYYMTEDESGNLWIMTYGGGINKIDESMINSDQPVFIHYLDDQKKIDGLSYYNLRSVYLDEQNQLWIGSLGNGIYKTRLNRKFTIIKNEAGNTNSLSDNHVNFIFRDSKGDIWIASRDGILNQLNCKTNIINHYPIYKSKQVFQNPFTCITEYENNLLYAINEKIYKINLKTGIITDFVKEINLPDTLVRIKDVYEAVNIDPQNNIVLAKPHFCLLLKKMGKTYSIKRLQIPVFKNFYADSKLNIWLATRFNGIYAYDSSFNNLFVRIVYQRAEYNSGYGFVETKDGSIWASTSKGLLKYNLKTKKYIYYEEKDGLISNDTRGILIDNQENIWLSTNHGLSRFNYKTKQFNNFDETNGLPITNFNKGVCCKGKDGKFYFGSDEGILSFYPDSLDFNNISPQVYITAFKVFNKDINIGQKIDGSIILDKGITYEDEIKPSYKSNVLYFEFAAMNYLFPEKNIYAYKMEGVDRDWNYVNADRRFASYAGLQYGEYIFKVKASNNDGIWNDKGTSLRIIILPPWWNTWWFRTIIAISIVSILLGGYKLRINVLKKNRRTLELLVAKRTEELNIAKVKAEASLQELESFSYSVSHDLRAPLRHIDGYANLLYENIESTIDELSKQYLVNISNSANKMGKLIDNLLSFSRYGQCEMHTTNVDLNSIIQDVIKDLQPDVNERKIIWHISEIPIVQGDDILLQSVIVNLISNALKFTRTRTQAVIEIGNVKDEKKEIIIFVRDNGVGFDMSYVSKLFGVFQRLHHTDEFEGTGIGLANVHRIIRRHGGRTWAVGEVNIGATFYFSLPKINIEDDYGKT
jgi:signal transduction histidine kinase/ligand-binding sensor domain-containing protein